MRQPGAAIDAVDDSGETALMKAARDRDSFAFYDALVDLGADTTLVNGKGATAADIRRETQRERERDFLIV